MRRFSSRIQFGFAVIIGAGLAFCCYRGYMAAVMRNGVVHDPWGALGRVYPGSMALGAIVSGLILRLMADRAWASLKSFLATPALYVFTYYFVPDLIRGDLTNGFWQLLLIVVGLTWPFTYLSFRIARRAPKRDPNAPPTCHKCGYNLTDNVSGICPECGTPVSIPGHLASSI